VNNVSFIVLHYFSNAVYVKEVCISLISVSSGVEAQTLTVWRQADRYHVPRIVFINKMDKQSADFNASLKSISDRLATVALPIQIPIGTGSTFTGVIDLLTLTKSIWSREDREDDGKEYCIQQLERTAEDASLYDETLAARSRLVEQLIDLDHDLGEEFLRVGDVGKLSAASVSAALRRVIIARRAVAVLCGSALRNCAVQPLLDAVVAYLPNPEERESTIQPLIKHYGNELCAMAFKIVYDKQRGPLTFLRVYAGSLSASASVYNVGRGVTERCAKLYQVYADEHKEVGCVTTGNITAVSGLKQVGLHSCSRIYYCLAFRRPDVVVPGQDCIRLRLRHSMRW